MRLRSLSQNCPRARRLRRTRVSLLLGGSVVSSLCAGALLAGPLARPVLAAPTLGGDENGPQVQILQPGYQDVLKGKTKILIAVKAQKFNPQSVEMFIDDKAATEGPIPFAALPSAQYDWDTKRFADGPHKLTVRVTDTQGFRGWAEVNIYINNDKKLDLTPPSLQWREISSYSQLSGLAQIELQTMDNFGVKWIIVSINPASEPNRKPALRSWLLNRPPYVVKFDSTKVPDGLYSVTAKAWDSFEQEGSAPPITVGVLNSGGINATTMAEMLRSMQAGTASVPSTTANAKSVAPPTSAVPTNVAPNSAARAADAASQGVPQTNAVAARPRAASNAHTAASATTHAAPKATATHVAKPGAALNAAGTARLQPASPAQMAPAPTRLARSNAAPAPALGTPADSNRSATDAVPEVALPRLSPTKGGAPTPDRMAPSGDIAAEIGGAVSDDWRTRLARAGAPQGATRAVAPDAPRLAANDAQTSDDAQTFSALARANGSLSAPNRAVEMSAAPRRTLESDQIAPFVPSATGRTSAPKPSARRVAAPTKAAPKTNGLAPASEVDSVASVPISPALSMEVLTPTSRVAPHVVASAPVETRLPSRLAVPHATELPLLAALPRAPKANNDSASNAITVSPLEVRASSALPAFHTVTRASDVRAVAARYGLPAAVVAACNGWSATQTLAAGTKVKLPQQLQVAYRGVPVAADAHSMLIGNTGVTAFRFLFEQQGGQLTWDAKNRRVIARKGQSEVTLTIGSKKAKVDDKEVLMELAAFLFEGRTMVPVRFFEEGLRAQVEWDPQTGRLVVAMAG